MARHYGSVSAGYMAPPPPVTGDIMIFSGGCNTLSGSEYYALNAIGTVGNGSTITNKCSTIIPVPGTFDQFTIQGDNPVLFADVILYLTDNGSDTTLLVDVAIGNTFSNSGSLSYHVNADDVLNFHCTNSDAFQETMWSIRFTPD